MITPQTKQLIRGYLEGFIKCMIEAKATNSFDPKKLRPLRQASKKGDLKPFHESLLPDGLLTIAEFERSFSTKLGTTFEECARLIALDHHQDAHRGYRVTGHISHTAIERIEHHINTIGTGGMKTTYPQLVQEITNLAAQGDTIERTNIADLYILKHDGTQLFIEIKSPKPNKGQCLEATSRLLHIHALTHNNTPPTRTYFACGYNPYGIEKDTYRHSFALKYLDVENEMLLGKEFWDTIGSPGTYEDLIDIYQQVGREKGPQMLNQLALGY